MKKGEKKMNILGIHTGHNATVALILDNKHIYSWNFKHINTLLEMLKFKVIERKFIALLFPFKLGNFFIFLNYKVFKSY